MVIDRVNGLFLEEPTESAMEEALLHNGDELAEFSEKCYGERTIQLTMFGCPVMHAFRVSYLFRAPAMLD